MKLRAGDRREIAIYLRDGTAWVADFKGSRGEISTAGAWFALNRGWASRRAVLNAVTPLPQELEERIERLHRHMEEHSDAPAIARALASLLARFAGWCVKLCGALPGRRPARPSASTLAQ
jgi:hypothetical protein